MPKLTLSSLAVRRGSTRVVHGLSLSIEPGRVFWVVGPNGAGKTSLLRVLAGIDTPAAGAVDREAPPDAPFRYFHSGMALPGWSVVGAWDRLVPRLDPRAGAPTPLRPDLSPDRWIRRLSTGEHKRLLLDALLRVPGSLLLDEPYEHLSPEAKNILSTLIRERARTAVVVVVTNQATQRAALEGGLRLEAGRARLLGRTLPGRSASSASSRCPDPAGPADRASSRALP